MNEAVPASTEPDSASSDQPPGQSSMTTGSLARYEDALAHSEPEHFILYLYITGSTPRSTQAIVNIKKVCEEHLQGRYQLEIIDIYQQPELASRDQIIATPTLIKLLPNPLRRLIGDLSSTERVLAGLGLRPI